MTLCFKKIRTPTDVAPEETKRMAEMSTVTLGGTQDGTDRSPKILAEMPAGTSARDIAKICSMSLRISRTKISAQVEDTGVTILF